MHKFDSIFICNSFVSDVNDCMPNPCQNDGNCTDGINKYNCMCVPGYNGTNCETGKQLKIHSKIRNLAYAQQHN